MDENLKKIIETLQSIYEELIEADRSFPLYAANNHLIDERIEKLCERFKEAMEQLNELCKGSEQLDAITETNVYRTGGALTLGIVRNLNYENVNTCGELLFKYISDIYLNYIFVDVVNGIMCYFIKHSIEYRKEGLAGEVMAFVINKMAQSYGVSISNIIADITNNFYHGIQGDLSFSTLFLNIVRQNPNLAYVVVGNLVNKIEQYGYDGRASYAISFLQKNNPESKDLISSYLTSFLFRYLERCLFELKKYTNRLIKCDRVRSDEEKLLSFLKHHNIIDRNIEKLDDIRIDFLINEWSKLFNYKIQYNAIDCGRFFEILPYILKDFTNGWTIGDLFKHKNLFDNFFYVDENTDYGKGQIELLKKKSKESGSIFVAYIVNAMHPFVSLFMEGDRLLIDSTLRNNQLNVNEYYCYFNKKDYQENETGYIHAGVAIKMILDLVIRRIPLRDALIHLAQTDNCQQDILAEMEGRDSLKECLFYLIQRGEGQQNFLTEHFMEIAQLYEFLGSAKNQQRNVVNNHEFLEPSVFAPTTQMNIQVVQQAQNNVDIRQQVQELRISRDNFIIQAKYLIEAFGKLNYKVAMFFKNRQNGIFPLMVDRITITKNEQRPRVIFNEGLSIDTGDDAEEHEDSQNKKGAKSTVQTFNKDYQVPRPKRKIPIDSSSLTSDEDNGELSVDSSGSMSESSIDTSRGSRGM